MKTKVLISCAVAAQLIYTYVFLYAKIRFTHDMAHIFYILRYSRMFDSYMCYKEGDLGSVFSIWSYTNLLLKELIIIFLFAFETA